MGPIVVRSAFDFRSRGTSSTLRSSPAVARSLRSVSSCTTRSAALVRTVICARVHLFREPVRDVAGAVTP